MEKILKRIRTIALLLVAFLIAITAFCGVYFKVSGTWFNKIPDFNYGMELSGMRELRFKLDDAEEEKEVYIDSDGNIAGEVIKENEEDSGEISLSQDETSNEDKTKENESIPEGYTIEKRVIKANDDSVINEENFEKVKRIIQSRLENTTYEYNIRLDIQTGELVIEVPDNDNVKNIETLVTTVGKIEIVDAQNGLLLLDDSGIKNAVSTYNTSTEKGYQAYMILNYDKKSSEKLKEISKEYVEVKNETVNTENTSETGSETESTINYIIIKLDNQNILKTYFGQELSNGTLQIPMGEAYTDVNEFSNLFKEVNDISQIVKSEKLPLSYKLSSDNYVQTKINKNNITLKVLFAIALIVVSGYLIIRYRFNGVKASIFSVGYVGLLIIILKYTNVIITLNSLMAFIGVIAINYVFNNKILQKVKNGADVKVSYLHSMRELYIALIPVCVISIIFTFMHSTIISSIGMVLFWGLFIIVIYNSILILLLNKEK